MPEWQDAAFLKQRRFPAFNDALGSAHAPAHEAPHEPAVERAPDESRHGRRHERSDVFSQAREDNAIGEAERARQRLHLLELRTAADAQQPRLRHDTGEPSHRSQQERNVLDRPDVADCAQHEVVVGKSQPLALSRAHQRHGAEMLAVDAVWNDRHRRRGTARAHRVLFHRVAVAEDPIGAAQGGPDHRGVTNHPGIAAAHRNFSPALPEAGNMKASDKSKNLLLSGSGVMSPMKFGRSP